MNTYKNKKFTKRDYDTTNVVFCQSIEPPDENWDKCHVREIDLLRCTQLYIQAGIKYFGYL